MLFNHSVNIIFKLYPESPNYAILEKITFHTTDIYFPDSEIKKH